MWGSMRASRVPGYPVCLPVLEGEAAAVVVAERDAGAAGLADHATRLVFVWAPWPGGGTARAGTAAAGWSRLDGGLALAFGRGRLGVVGVRGGLLPLEGVPGKQVSRRRETMRRHTQGTGRKAWSVG
jgi:hypothetical protein